MMANEIESLGDFNTQWIFAQYEAGKAVAEIAAGMKVCESAVYARIRMRPETYEELKQVREELYCPRQRRLRGLFRKFLYKINRPSLDKSKIHATI